MVAALAAYPELGCTGGPYEVEKNWGIFEDVLCIGNDKTMQFIEDVLGEVALISMSTSEVTKLHAIVGPNVRSARHVSKQRA